MKELNEKERIEKLYLLEDTLYNKVVDHLDNTLYKVAWILKRYKDARNYDNLLIFTYWKNVDKFDMSFHEGKIKALTPPESIRRVRQKIQNEFGLFLPTSQEVIEKRKIKQEAVRYWATSRINY